MGLSWTDRPAENEIFGIVPLVVSESDELGLDLAFGWRLGDEFIHRGVSVSGWHSGAFLIATECVFGQPVRVGLPLRFLLCLTSWAVGGSDEATPEELNSLLLNKLHAVEVTPRFAPSLFDNLLR